MHAHLPQALLVLEAAQQRRKVSAPLRLAATGLYSLLGAPTAAAESFGALDIKHIQHDTLSGARHLCCHATGTLQLVLLQSRVCKRSSIWHLQNMVPLPCMSKLAHGLERRMRPRARWFHAPGHLMKGCCCAASSKK